MWNNLFGCSFHGWNASNSYQKQMEILTTQLHAANLQDSLLNQIAQKPSRPSDLGPKQLQWCRENLPHFQRCEEQALASKGESK